MDHRGDGDSRLLSLLGELSPAKFHIRKLNCSTSQMQMKAPLATRRDVSKARELRSQPQIANGCSGGTLLPHPCQR